MAPHQSLLLPSSHISFQTKEDLPHSVGFVSGTGPSCKSNDSRRRSHVALSVTFPFHVPGVSRTCADVALNPTGDMLQGDYVADTPAEKTANFGDCPSSHGECQLRGWPSFQSPCCMRCSLAYSVWATN